MISIATPSGRDLCVNNFGNSERQPSFASTFNGDAFANRFAHRPLSLTHLFVESPLHDLFFESFTLLKMKSRGGTLFVQPPVTYFLA